MVNNSTNINKTNNNLSSQIIEHKKKKTMTYDIGNSGPDLRQALNCSGVKPVNVIYIYIPSSVGSPWIHSTLHVVL